MKLDTNIASKCRELLLKGLSFLHNQYPKHSIRDIENVLHNVVYKLEKRDEIFTKIAKESGEYKISYFFTSLVNEATDVKSKSNYNKLTDTYGDCFDVIDRCMQGYNPSDVTLIRIDLINALDSSFHEFRNSPIDQVIIRAIKMHVAVGINVTNKGISDMTEIEIDKVNYRLKRKIFPFLRKVLH